MNKIELRPNDAGAGAWPEGLTRVPYWVFQDQAIYVEEIVGAFAIGPAMDRIGPYSSLATVYLAGVLFVVLFGFSIDGPSWLLLVTVFCAGFCISGGQKSVIALAAIYYPTPIRSTGVGWALGIGRLGGVAGPLLIGALLAYQLSAQHILYAAAVPMLLAGLLVALLCRWYAAAGVSVHL